ncbi:hypothetical protein [Castellaniella sp.]|uniref:hypothetical protein n=1 Tax=Castellaniella sp. TaxID=1955812 RepID=UPI002AFE1425|nr:hypothetical protein [Castellaniella sp.]
MLSSTLSPVPDLLSAAPVVDLRRILRAVASSTAIETGQAVHELESQLQSDSRFPTLELAAPTLA